MKTTLKGLGFALLILVVAFIVKGKEVRVSGGDVKSYASQNLEKSYEWSGSNGALKMERPEISISDGKFYISIEVEGHAEAMSVKKTFEGTVVFSGKIGWEKGGVTIIDPSVEEWSFEGINPLIGAAIENFLADHLVQGLLANHPVYRLTDEEKGMLPSLVTIRNAELDGTDLVVELGYII